MLAGISTRRYSVAFQPVGLPSRLGVGHVEVGDVASPCDRHSPRLAELLDPRLDTYRWLIVNVDGFGRGDHLLVGTSVSPPAAPISPWV